MGNFTFKEEARHSNAHSSAEGCQKGQNSFSHLPLMALQQGLPLLRADKDNCAEHIADQAVTSFASGLEAGHGTDTNLLV